MIYSVSFFPAHRIFLWAGFFFVRKGLASASAVASIVIAAEAAAAAKKQDDPDTAVIAAAAASAAITMDATADADAKMCIRDRPVSKRDGPCLIQKKRVYVPGRLNGPAAHSQHVRLVQPAHSRNTNGRQQCADGGWSKADQKRDQRSDGSRILNPRLICTERCV